MDTDEDDLRDLKIVWDKVSTKNIIPDMGHGRPIDFSHIRTYRDESSVNC